MSLIRLKIALGLTMRDMSRRRITLIMLFVIPMIFLEIVNLTTGDTAVLMELRSFENNPAVEVGSRNLSLIFISIASVGLLASFLGMSLVQQEVEASRRLVLSGFRTTELILSKLLVLVLFVLVVSGLVVLVTRFYVHAQRLWVVGFGFALAGWVYGCYGILIGALFRRELEGILFIVLLANIDAGWLQNPVYYTTAQNTEIIHRLPAFFPAQTGLAGAFTELNVLRPAVGALLYGVALLCIALVVYAFRLRIFRAK